jgi:hypothetical protein
MDRKKILEGWVMECNSKCKCGVLDIRLSPFDYTNRERENPHLKITKVRITIEEIK